MKINQAKLKMELTSLDIRESKLKHHNPYALGHYLVAAEKVTNLKTFIKAFNPTRGLHSVAKKLNLPLNVVKGQWVILE